MNCPRWGRYREAGKAAIHVLLQLKKLEPTYLEEPLFPEPMQLGEDTAVETLGWRAAKVTSWDCSSARKTGVKRILFDLLKLQFTGSDMSDFLTTLWCLWWLKIGVELSNSMRLSFLMKAVLKQKEKNGVRKKKMIRANKHLVIKEVVVIADNIAPIRERESTSRLRYSDDRIADSCCKL